MSKQNPKSTARDILQHLTLDLNSKSSQALFDLWKTKGRIHCDSCNSWGDIKAVVAKMKKDGKSLKEIRKATISHKNVLGEFIIDRTGFSARNIRDDLHITTERIIKEWGDARRPGYGDLAVKSWKTKIKQNWDKLAPNDKKKFIKLFGVKGDLREIHKGHSFASMIGGLADPSNIAPQLGALNTALQENPRFALDLMEQWGMGGDGTKAFFNSRLAKIDPTNIPDPIWLHLGETGVVDPEQLEILTAKLGELQQQGVNIHEIGPEFWETGEDVSLESINRKLTSETSELPKVKSQQQKIAALKNQQILNVVDPVTNETVFSPIEEQVVNLKKNFLEAETEWQHSKKTNPLLKERNIDPLSRRRAIATGATLGSITALGAVGAPFSVAGAAERLEIAQQTGKPTDYLAAGLEGVSAVGDVSGPGGEVVATAADLALLGMDAPQTYEALMHRSDPEVELAKQEQKEQDSVTSYTAQVGMDPQQRLVERSNTRQQQYKDKLTAHQKGREQEKQWQLQGQDYVTQTPNIAERANQTLTKLTTDPLNEIEWGVSQMINWLNKKQD